MNLSAEKRVCPRFRSPTNAFQYMSGHDVPSLDAQTPFLGSVAAVGQTAVAATATPHHVVNPSRTPSTAELLRAAHSGSTTAKLGRQLYELQLQTSRAAEEPTRNVTFAPGAPENTFSCRYISVLDAVMFQNCRT